MSTRFYFCRNCGEGTGNGNMTREHCLKFPHHVYIEQHNIVGIREPYAVWRRVTRKTLPSMPAGPSRIIQLKQFYTVLKGYSGIIGLGITAVKGLSDLINWLSSLNLGNLYRRSKS